MPWLEPRCWRTPRPFFDDSRPRVVAFCDAVRIVDVIPDGLDLTMWAPFHYDPPAPGMIEWLHRARPRLVALTEFGRSRFAEADLDSVVVPHGIDLTIFRPPAPAERADRRAALGLPEDAFVVSIVGVNGDWSANRKNFPEMILAAAEFCRAQSDAFLYLHTDHDARLHGGIDLAPVFHAAGFPPGRVAVTDRERYRLGLDPHEVAAIYQASDVLLATSAGEGFGIPVIEAQACGVPVVVSDFTCQPELVGSGRVVGGQRRWYPPARSWLFTPSIAEIVDALTELHRIAGGSDDVAREFATAYDIDDVARRWVDLLAMP